MTQPMWAPWRLEYILAKKGPGCIFCEKPGEERDRENLILYRGKLAFVIMNLYPYNNGHLMVLPYRHVCSLTDLTDDEMLELMQLNRTAVACLKKAFLPEGYNIGVNLGKVAGAGIEEHLHFHIIPRWVGDTHFMAVLSEVRVIPQHVLSTYDKLHPLFNPGMSQQGE
jgi:ATP adenylyltransferase